MTRFSCAVADCFADVRKSADKYPWMKEVKGFTRFPPPKKEAERRRKWENLCRREDGWKAGQHSAICSRHFVEWKNGRPSNEHPDPELFAYNDWGKNCLSAKKRLRNALQIMRPPVPMAEQENVENTPPPAKVARTDIVYMNDACVGEQIDTELQEFPTHNFITQVEPGAALTDHTYPIASCQPDVVLPSTSSTQTDPPQTTINSTKSTQTDVQSLAAALSDKDIDTVLRESFKRKVLQSDRSVRKYTGLESTKKLFGIYTIVQRKVSRIQYWRGPKTVEQNAPQQKTKDRKLSKFDEYLATLVYLREGFEHTVLADLFGVSETIMSITLTTWINVLYQVFRKWLKWPSAEQVRIHLPTDYPAKYRDTRIILDCTEFFISRPGNSDAQHLTYSQYKHHNTAKLLVGISPTGLITCVSDVWGGNASDRHITENDPVLNKMEARDAVMVDRGFNIGDVLLKCGVKLHIPPFTRKKEGGNGKKLNQSEIKKTREIASLRIHVERAIERMKNYKLLTRQLDLHILPLMDQIMVIVAVLCNFEPPLKK